MPVSHDLFQDLSCTKEEIQQKRTEDPRLDSLLNKYSEADKNVVEAENAKSDDDALKKLKEKRLTVKNEIVERLQAHS